jgi:hypothetical protein
LIGRETVLDGIMTAGGLSEEASTCQVVLSRPTPPAGCRVVLPVCYREITQLGDTTTNYQLRPGDRIVVSTRTLTESLVMFLLPGRSWSPCDGVQCGCADPNCTPTGPAISGALTPYPAPLLPAESESLPPPQPEAPEVTVR